MFLNVVEVDRSATGPSSFGRIDLQYVTPTGKTIFVPGARTDRGIHLLRYGTIIDQLKDKTVLDIGCGGGQFVKDLRSLELSKRPKRVIGLDLKLPSFIRSESDFVQGNVLEMPFSNETFDVAFSSASFFYYVHDHEVLVQGLSEVVRVLKIKGTFHTSSNFQEMKRAAEAFGNQISIVQDTFGEITLTRNW